MARAGAAGLGVTLGAGTGASGEAEAAAGHPAAGSFFGTHQAGIATPTQEHVHFLALDVVSDATGDLRALLAALSDGASRLTSGNPVGALRTSVDPPVDTGEAVGLGAARLTVTFGLGPSLFKPGRFGLESRRPAPLVDLPTFANDSLQPAISNGDIAVQACAEDPTGGVSCHPRPDPPRQPDRGSSLVAGRVRSHAQRDRPADPPEHSRVQGGHGQHHRAGSGGARPVRVGGSIRLAGLDERRLLHGRAARRIQLLLHHWDSVSLDQQERTFGRHKLSGAPLGERHEFDPIDLNRVVDGRLAISRLAHVRLASPAYNNGERILPPESGARRVRRPGPVRLKRVSR